MCKNVRCIFQAKKILSLSASVCENALTSRWPLLTNPFPMRQIRRAFYLHCRKLTFDWLLLYSNIVFAFLVTANVTVTSCADAVDWNRPCTLTCSAFDGIPPDYTLQWQFKSKFSDTFQVLTSEIAGNSTDLSLSIVTMGDAGTYRCNARNFAGATWADLQLEVNCKQ